VIRNRLQSGRWGPTYSTVVFAPKQFSCWNVDDVNLPTLRDYSQTLSSGHTPADAALRRCLWIADGTVRTCFDSVVRDATHYFAIAMKQPPEWAATGEYVDHIGGHAFYRSVK
jgi:N-acetylmuramoyl-L-alanine amidase